jgi:trk system potassium uptake protein TrkH
MRLEVCVKYTGFILLIIGAGILLSALVGWFYQDESALNLTVSGLLICGIGIFPYIFIPKADNISTKEAILIVTGVWTIGTIAGGLPFYLYGEPFNFVRAWFEIVSGFTTTGGSILAIVEDLPKGLLFWRSFSQWIGGTGIVIFAIVVLPALDYVSPPIFRQEYSAASQHIYPRTKSISVALVYTYIIITLAEIVALMLTGLGLYDAVTISFSTLATGGFSVKNTSLAAYNNLPAEIVVMIFMTISSMNLVFLHTLLFWRKQKVVGWEVARLNLIILAVVIVFTTISLYGRIYHSFGESLRYASFTVIAQATTTGFANADDSIWNAPALILLILITFTGACSGSTGGAIKVDRALIFLKLLRYKVRKLYHPKAAGIIRIDGNAIEINDAKDAMLFSTLYIVIVLIATIMLTFMGVNLLEAFTGTAACMGNVGPGLGAVGSMGNFSGIPDLGIFILTLVMLVGRLEIYILIIPFSRGFWRV